MAEISVIVPTYNSEGTIEKCIESILRQGFRDFEILVVDCSGDGTRERVKRFRKVKLVCLKERVFPGEARNEGIRRAKGRILAFIDSDCIAGGDWLENIGRAAQKFKVVGGPIDNGARGLVSWADHFLSFSEFLPGEGLQIKGFMPTCNIAYRRGIFRKYGLFPRERRASEDVLFNTRVGKGERMAFDPGIRIWHKSRTGFRDFLRHQNLLGRNAAEVRIENKGIYGGFLIKSPLFGLLLPGIRVFRISKRVFRSRRVSPRTGNSTDPTPDKHIRSEYLLTAVKPDGFPVRTSEVGVSRLANLYIASFPLILIGLASWCAGFMEAVVRNED